jgi:hypothetical protein
MWFLTRQPAIRAAAAIVLAPVLLGLTGCVSIPGPTELAKRSDALRNRLLELGPHVDYREAGLVASTAEETAMASGQKYRALRPAWFNNVLVNHGFKEGGLCYHWANDLFAALSAVPVSSLTAHLAVSRLATPREHNAVVITAHGQPFAEGVVLDAWRKGGRLSWFAVSNDLRHAWVPLPPGISPVDPRPAEAP